MPDDDDRAGSDVEEIEAKAREQERLLSATDDDSPTGDAKLPGRWLPGRGQSAAPVRRAGGGGGREGRCHFLPSGVGAFVVRLTVTCAAPPGGYC